MIDFKLLIDKALKLGFEDIEIIEKSKKSLEISLFDSKVDQNVLSSNNSISVRALYNEKMVNMNIENFDIDIDEVLNKLKNNALSIDSEEKNEIFAGSKEYPTVEKNTFDFNTIDTSKKIEFLLKLERKVKELVLQTESIFYIIAEMSIDIFASVAQLVEQLIRNQ